MDGTFEMITALQYRVKALQHELDEFRSGERYMKHAIIEELKVRLAHAEALLGHDSTNTGMPTSQTPLGKKKHIPNGRIEA